MQRSILYLQWKAVRWLLAPLIAAALGAPLLIMVAAAQANDPSSIVYNAAELSLIFPMLAVLTGVSLGFMAWAWDHRERHVYALALPIARTRYVMLKFLAGVALLVLPAIALWLGAFVTAAAIDLPDRLRAYPFSFGFRFLLGSFVMYALAFALASGTARVAFWVLVGFMVYLIGGGFLMGMFEWMFQTSLPDPLELLHLALVRLPGPFHVFGGSWSLIDV